VIQPKLLSTYQHLIQPNQRTYNAAKIYLNHKDMQQIQHTKAKVPRRNKNLDAPINRGLPMVGDVDEIAKNADQLIQII
jgi:hypothetical protein